MTCVENDRFALQLFNQGAVLLDLESGSLFQLNETARFVWERALRGAADDSIATALSAHFGISHEMARSAVSSSLQGATGAVPPRQRGPLVYQEVEDGYRLSDSSAPVLDIAADGTSVRLCAPLQREELILHVRGIAPRVLALRGQIVVHAAAVARADGKVMAFVGDSGAGKTTTAQAFSDAGMRPICQDKLVLKIAGQQVTAVTDAEEKIISFISASRELLIGAAPGEWYRLPQTRELTTGPALPVAEVLVLDRERRQGNDLLLHLLPEAEATAAIFGHAFHASSSSKVWRKELAFAASLARQARAYRPTMPQGLAALAAEAARYTGMTAS